MSSNPAEKICSNLSYLGTLSRIVPMLLIEYEYVSEFLINRKNFAYFWSSQQSNNSFKVNPLSWLHKFFTGLPLIPIAVFVAKSYFTVRPSS